LPRPNPPTFAENNAAASRTREATITGDGVKSSAIDDEHLDPTEVRSSIARRPGLNVEAVPPASGAVNPVVGMMLDATQRLRGGGNCRAGVNTPERDMCKN